MQHYFDCIYIHNNHSDKINGNDTTLYNKNVINKLLQITAKNRFYRFKVNVMLIRFTYKLVLISLSKKI